MGKIPQIVSNRLVDQIDMLANDIESCDFPSGTREGLYERALDKIKKFQQDEINRDEFLEETFLNKKNDVYLALRLIMTDSDAITLERSKEKINKLKEKLNDEDATGADFYPS